jgi:hypothetical protein
MGKSCPVPPLILNSRSRNICRSSNPLRKRRRRRVGLMARVVDASGRCLFYDWRIIVRGLGRRRTILPLDVRELHVAVPIRRQLGIGKASAVHMPSDPAALDGDMRVVVKSLTGLINCSDVNARAVHVRGKLLEKGPSYRICTVAKERSRAA